MSNTNNTPNTPNFFSTYKVESRSGWLVGYYTDEFAAKCAAKREGAVAYYRTELGNWMEVYAG